MKSIKELKNLAGKKIILRADFNVPMKNGVVVDDFRIKKVIPTILYLQEKGAKVIILSHLGEDGSESLAHVELKIKKLIKNFDFIGTPIFSDETEKRVNNLKNGEVVLLENLRK